MICGIDNILDDSKQTVDETINRLIQELAADLNLEISPEVVSGSAETRKLRGAIESFAVWLAHGRATKP